MMPTIKMQNTYNLAKKIRDKLSKSEFKCTNIGYNHFFYDYSKL